MAKFHAYDELDDAPKSGRKTKRGRRASLLGMLAMLVALASVVVLNRDKVNTMLQERGVGCGGYLWEVEGNPVHAYHLAGAAAGLALFALLLRKFTGRTRAGWPVLALLVAAGVAGTYRYYSSPRLEGSPERWVQDNVVVKVEQWWAGVNAPSPAVEPAPKSGPVEVKTEDVPPVTSPSVTSPSGEPATKPSTVVTPAEPPKEKSRLFGI